MMSWTYCLSVQNLASPSAAYTKLPALAKVLALFPSPFSYLLEGFAMSRSLLIVQCQINAAVIRKMSLIPSHLPSKNPQDEICDSVPFLQIEYYMRYTLVVVTKQTTIQQFSAINYYCFHWRNNAILIRYSLPASYPILY